MIDPGHTRLSMHHQRDLVSISAVDSDACIGVPTEAAVVARHTRTSSLQPDLNENDSGKVGTVQSMLMRK
jgi:hypothetical protein